MVLENNISTALPLIFSEAGGAYNKSIRNSNISGNDIYNSIYPNIKHYDGINSVTHVVSGSTVEHATGLSGYIKSDTPAPTNAVALFGCGTATTNDAAIWGINTLLQDKEERSIGTLTGIKLINELDFNVMNPATSVVGMSLGGNSLSQPVSANAFIANTLGAGIKWTTGFYAMDGTCQNAFAVGLSETSGNNVPSSNILIQSTNAVGEKKTAVLNAQAGSFVVLSGMSFKVANGDILLDSGQRLVVNGKAIVRDRATGWGAPVGTATRTTFSTSTVTTEELAERVKALIDDLTYWHGLVGA